MHIRSASNKDIYWVKSIDLGLKHSKSFELIILYTQIHKILITNSHTFIIKLSHLKLSLIIYVFNAYVILV